MSDPSLSLIRRSSLFDVDGRSRTAHVGMLYEQEGHMQMTGSMDGRVCMVTGANSGIGKETAVALARMGATVVMVSRDRQKGEAAMAEVRTRSRHERVELLLADFASQQSIRRLAADFRAGHPLLHVLVNNAGAFNARRTVTANGYETTFAVNHLGYFLLTNLLLDTLKAAEPSRIVNVSSRGHSGATINFDDLHKERGYGGMGAYGQSKLANVLFTYELARRLEETGVTANCLHPGGVMTGFGKNNSGFFKAVFTVAYIIGRPFLLTPAQGAETPVYLAASPDVEGVTAKYFVKKTAVRSSDISYDEGIARRLWQVSEEMTKPTEPTAT